MSLSMADSSSSLAAWSEVTLLRLVISERASNLQETWRENPAGQDGASTVRMRMRAGFSGVQEGGQHTHAGGCAGQDRTGQGVLGLKS